MASVTHLLLFGLCAILAECTFPHLHHGLHHGMHGGMMYGSPYMYPGMGMGMGMQNGGSMMYGMGPGMMYTMPFREEAEGADKDNTEKVTPEKSESDSPDLTPFQEKNHESVPRSEGSFGDLDLELTTETIRHLVKREVDKDEKKYITESDSEQPIIFPNEDIQDIPKKSEEDKENAATESIHEYKSNVNEKNTPELAQNRDDVMIPIIIIEAANSVLPDTYDNQRDEQALITANSESTIQGLNTPNLNHYQNNIQNQIPVYGNQMTNNVNGISQNFNQIPVNNIGNKPGVLTFLTLMGPQAGNVPSNQYYVHTPPQVNIPGNQNTQSYNVIPTNQPQLNLIGILGRPNNQYINGLPINNQLVSMVPINGQTSNLLPVSNNYVPAYRYVLLNNQQNLEPLPNQAGLNAWNVPVSSQPLNSNQQPFNYNQQPNIVTLNGQPNTVQSVDNVSYALPQGNLALNDIHKFEQTQPLNDNGQYIPVSITRDEVDKN